MVPTPKRRPTSSEDPPWSHHVKARVAEGTAQQPQGSLAHSQRWPRGYSPQRMRDVESAGQSMKVTATRSAHNYLRTPDTSDGRIKEKRDERGAEFFGTRADSGLHAIADSIVARTQTQVARKKVNEAVARSSMPMDDVKDALGSRGAQRTSIDVAGEPSSRFSGHMRTEYDYDEGMNATPVVLHTRALADDRPDETLIHELGHVVDFRRNYEQAAQASAGVGDPGDPDGTAWQEWPKQVARPARQDWNNSQWAAVSGADPFKEGHAVGYEARNFRGRHGERMEATDSGYEGDDFFIPYDLGDMGRTAYEFTRDYTKATGQKPRTMSPKDGWVEAPVTKHLSTLQDQKIEALSRRYNPAIVQQQQFDL